MKIKVLSAAGETPVTNANVNIQFPDTLDLLAEGVQILNHSWHYVYANNRSVRSDDHTREKLPERTLMERYPGIENSEVFHVLENCMSERKRRQAKIEFDFPDKSKRWFELTIEPVEAGILILSKDVTALVEKDAKTIKANNLNAFICQINQYIVRIKDQEMLFHDSCRIATAFGKFKMAWIGLLDLEKESISLTDQSGMPDEDIDLFIAATYPDIVQEEYVLFTDSHYICNNIEREYEPGNWKMFASKNEISSCVVLPLRKSGEIIGTLNLYASELYYFGTNEISQLLEAAKSISFALDLFENTKKQKLAEELIATSEAKYKLTMDNMLEGAQILDTNWKYIYVNEALVNYSTYSKEELVGYTLLEKYPGIEQTALFKVLEKCMYQRTSELFENEFVFPDGSKKYFELSIQPVPEGIFILSLDKSEQKKTNAKLLKANRLYSFLSAVNQSIVHINVEKELLRNACSIAVEIGQFKMAWIGLLDENGKLNMVQLHGDEPTIQRLQIYSAMDFTIPLLVDTPTGRVLRTGKYALSNDVHNDPVMAPWRDEHVLQGIKANISLPLIKFGKVIGIFGLNSTIENFFDEEEINLLNEAARDVSFALELFEKARKHKETEELVERNEKLFRTLIEKSGSIKALGTREGKIFYVSPSVTKYLGYTLDEFLHLSFSYLVHDDDLQEFLGKRSEILEKDGTSFYHQLRVKHQNGNWIWCECNITNLLNEPGINALVANVTDISDKKIIEDKFEFEKNNLDALINNTKDLMWSVDKEFNLLTSNQPFDEMVKLISGKVIEKGNSVLEASISEEQSNRHKGFLQRAFSGETFTEIEYIDQPERFWSEISFYPIRNAGQIVGTACHSHDITERIISEEKQQKFIKEISDYKYALNESSIVAITDQKGIIQHLNDNFCKISNYNREELIGEDHRMVNSAHHSKQFIQDLWSTIANGKTWKGEIKNKAKDGSIYWVDTTIVPFLDVRNKPYQYIAIQSDITKRKAGEEALVQSEKRLKEAQAIAHLGSWEMNILTGEVFWSEEQCRIYGILPHESTQTYLNWISFIHPDDFDYVTILLNEAQLLMSDTIINHRIILRNGTIKHVSLKAIFVLDKDSKLIGLHGITHDITELEVKEQHLRKSEAFNRGVLRSLNSQFAVVDNAGQIVAVNEAWKKFANENGITDFERVGEGINYFEVCENSAKAGDETAFQALLGMKEVLEEKKDEFYYEYPCHAPDIQRWSSMRVMKFDNDESMILVLHQDITERKLVEETLIHRNEDLQKANTELDRFVYSASHDLRSPLTSILGLVYLIEIQDNTKETLECLKMIKTSIHRLDGFISDILNYSRNNRADINISEISVQDTVNAIVNSLRNMKEAEGMSFEVNIDRLEPFYSDLHRFEIVISNLISNAIKFHDKSKEDKFVRITGKSDINNLHLAVEDNGIGITPEFQNRIFDMFFRLPGKAAGSGIGLYIVKETIEKIQGKIKVDSIEGVGTTFNLKIKNLKVKA